MRVMNHWIHAVAVLLAVMLSSHSSAQDSILDTARVLAEVPVVRGRIDQSVYRQIDRLVPELKRISKDKIVKLECRYSGQAEREQDVVRAYQIAGSIEKYLRIQYNLNLDLWITIRLCSKKTSPVLTIAVFADDINRLDSKPIDPVKTSEH